MRLQQDRRVTPAGDGHLTDAIVLAEADGRIAHRDIGAISATEIDGITINRTKNRLSPFVPILKTETHSAHSGNLTGYAIEIEDPDEPRGYRFIANVSKDYLLLTNEEVRDVALTVAQRSGLPFQESRIFWDGARFAHIIDFADEIDEVVPGDGFGLSLITRTSYNKVWAYETALMGKRFVCDNGVLSGEFFARVRFKHTDDTRSGSWRDLVGQGLSVLQNAPGQLRRLVQAFRHLKRTALSHEALATLWTMTQKDVTPGTWGQIMDRYLKAEEASLYGLLNAGTNVFWHSKTTTASDFHGNAAFVDAMARYAGGLR